MIDLTGQSTDSLEFIHNTQGSAQMDSRYPVSFSTFTNSELTETGSWNILNALQSRVAGAEISPASGAPGASTRIFIRGIKSLSGNNQPLFVIDGIPVGNIYIGSTSINGSTDFGIPVNDINPEDIGSVSILKGTASSAMYGSRASNGVIMITTKRGPESGGIHLGFSTSVTLEQPLRLVEYQDRFGQGIYGDTDPHESLSWGPVFDHRFRYWGHAVGDSLRIKAYRPLPDNVKEFFETGKSFNNAVSVYGDNQKSNFYFSYSNLTWNGIYPSRADIYSRHTASLRASYQLTKKLNTAISLNYIRKDNSFVPAGQGPQSVYDILMQTPRDISLRELSDLHSPFNAPENYYSLYTVNPYYILVSNNAVNDNNWYSGSLSLSYRILENLSLQWILGGELSDVKYNSPRAMILPHGNNGFSELSDPGIDKSGSVDQQFLASDIFLSYQKKILDWQFSFGVSQKVSRQYVEAESTWLTGLSASSTGSTPIREEANYMLNLQSVAGSVDIAFRSLFNASVNLMNEWSPAFPGEKKSYFSPAVTGEFNVTELFPSGNILTFGRIRASYGRMGNIPRPDKIYSLFNQGLNSYYKGSRPWADSAWSYNLGDLTAGNDLKQEITSEWEAGIDLDFFRDRLSLDMTYYHRTTDQLIWPDAAGLLQNLGKVTNCGFEGYLAVKPIVSEMFSWEIGVNLTRNYNNLESLNGQLDSAVLFKLTDPGGQHIEWLAIPGMPVGVYKARGVLRTSEGKMVVDRNGLPVADDELTVIGNSQSKYSGGISNRISYKNLSLSFLIDFRKGGIMYSRTKEISRWAGTAKATLYNDRKPFIIPNSVVDVGQDGETVYVDNTKPIDNLTLATFWGNGGFEMDGGPFIDRSYIRLHEAVVSYNVPDRFFGKIPVDELIFSVVGHNLLLFTPSGQDYIDPEVTTFGNGLLSGFGEYGAQPSVRSVMFKMKVCF